MKPNFKPFAFRLQLLGVLAVLLTTNQLLRANEALWIGTNNLSATTNWSDPLNWINIGSGGTGPYQNAATFDDSTGVGDTTTINNVVNDNENPFSLAYTNFVTHQNTLIAPGQTLTISTGGLTMGTSTALGTAVAPTTTISGAGGTLVVSNGNVTVALSYPATSGGPATLDMSGLDTFIATNIARILVGQGSARMSGALYLAKTNYINLTGSSPQLDIGDNSSNNGPGSKLYLGQNNVLLVDSIAMGLKKQNSGGGGTLAFNPAFTANNPVVYIRGTNGVGPVSTWAIADGQAQSGTITDTGTSDFSGGTVDALVDSMWLARNSPSASGGSSANNATLTFGAGTINVNNLTNAMLASSARTPSVTGTINVNGTGTLVVNNNLVMAATNSFIGSAQAQINITGGSVLANQITCGGGISYIQMTGGLLVVSNTVGSASQPLSYYVLSGGATNQFSLVDSMTPAAAADILSIDTSEIINISSLPVVLGYPSQFPVMTYNSFSGSTPTLGTLPSTFQGYLTNDNVSTIWVVITNGPVTAKTDEWVGNLDNNWNTTTKNWLSGGNSVAYNENDAVIFDDSANLGVVTLTAAHTPLACTITNNTLAYTFSGSGSISGATGLEKDGSASATLSETGGDNFTGGVTVNGGTLVLDNANSAIGGDLTIAGGATVQIGNGDANGNLPSGNVQDDGTLIFNRTDNVSVGTAIAGAGGLTQNGSGTLTLSGANTYTGNTTVSAGTLALTGSGSIPASTQVNVGAAALDVSGVSGVTTLNGLSVANSTLNVAVAYARTPINVASLTAGGAANTINVASLPPVASYPTTISLIKSSSTIGGSFNFTLGSLPSASPAYAGSITESSDQTAVQLTLTSGPTGVRPYVVWSGADVPNLNTNWSDALNWQLPGAPAAADSVIFSDVAAVGGSPFSAVGNGPGGIANPGFVNNIVDSGFGGMIRSLTYTNLNNYQNTLLANGVTLTTSNLTVGNSSLDFGETTLENVTIAGLGGQLNVNNTGAAVFVGLTSVSSGSHLGTLDLSGLGKFNANISQLLIGSASTISTRPIGAAYLAMTNRLTLNSTNAVNEGATGSPTMVALSVGVQGDSSGQSYLYLGETNAIYADYVQIGGSKQPGTVAFNPVLTNAVPVNGPVAYFRGADGVSPVTLWTMGDAFSQSGASSAPEGTADFSGGVVNALVTTMQVGRSPSHSNTGTAPCVGTLTFDAGSVNVGDLYVGLQPASNSKPATGTVNVSGTGVLTVNNLNLAFTTGGTGAAGTTATVDIEGGTVQAGTIVGDATGTSYISLTDGTLSVANTAGAPGAPLTYLVLTGGTLELNVNGSAGVTNVVASTIATSGTTTLKIGSLTGVATGITYPLISYTGTDPYASLTLAALPAGYAGNLVDDTANSLIGLQLTSAPTQSPVVTGISVQGGNIVISGTNGTSGNGYYVLTSTNLAQPLADWTPLATNTFMEGGNFSFTNTVNANAPRQFFILKLQ